MKNITVFISLPFYLSDWLVYLYGEPLKFPTRSPENDLLHVLAVRSGCRRCPASMHSIDQTRATHRRVRVFLPDRSFHKPEHYHHLSAECAAVFVRYLHRIFRLTLWNVGCSLIESGRPLAPGIDDWCASHGITVAHREAVRRKFYRIRSGYAARGIVLRQRLSSSFL